MDATRKIQDGIHGLSLDHKSMCPGIWVHIMPAAPLFSIALMPRVEADGVDDRLDGVFDG